MKDIIIIGAGGVGRETIDLIDAINSVCPKWIIKGFVDSNRALWGNLIKGYPVLGDEDYLNGLNTETYSVCTISVPRIKKSAIQKVTNPNIVYANLIHPTAVIAGDISLGLGIIIQAYSILSTNVKVGDHVQINPQCGIGHDSRIGSFSSLYWNVNVSGNVNIGQGCILGTKSTVIQGLKVGEGAIVGSASNVIRDLPPNCTAVGNPAKPIKYFEN